MQNNSKENSIVTRNLNEYIDETGNLYESLVIIAKRSNQIASNIKEELTEKLVEFQVSSDSLEEVFENREQIEISRHFERMPKPTLVALKEYVEGKVYARNPGKID
ncbi:MAG: DNA-directed RNA polymerase subunit omega [Bacteroidia bacterium]|nr:DNA-directed RNA polymerase subunit omega [Bacteroidia bacterium]